jgi:hypothetical protein
LDRWTFAGAWRRNRPPQETTEDGWRAGARSIWQSPLVPPPQPGNTRSKPRRLPRRTSRLAAAANASVRVVPPSPPVSGLLYIVHAGFRRSAPPAQSFPRRNRGRWRSCAEGGTQGRAQPPGRTNTACSHWNFQNGGAAAFQPERSIRSRRARAG